MREKITSICYAIFIRCYVIFTRPLERRIQDRRLRSLSRLHCPRENEATPDKAYYDQLARYMREIRETAEARAVLMAFVKNKSMPK